MPTLQELQDRHNTLIKRRDECEQQARDHEQKARDLRAEMATCKIEAAEIRQQIGTEANRQAATESLEAAKAAQHSAEQTAQSLKAKEAAIDGGLADIARLKQELEEKLKAD